MSSLVVDTCVIRLYDLPLDPAYAELFKWIDEEGILYVNKKLVGEYISTGNRQVSILLQKLTKDSKKKRLIDIKKSEIERFDLDRNFRYTCNFEDQYHSKTVFLSPNKKLITQDKKLLGDVNRFKKVAGKKPEAVIRPKKDFYANP